MLGLARPSRVHFLIVIIQFYDEYYLRESSLILETSSITGCQAKYESYNRNLNIFIRRNLFQFICVGSPLIYYLLPVHDYFYLLLSLFCSSMLCYALFSSFSILFCSALFWFVLFCSVLIFFFFFFSSIVLCCFYCIVPHHTISYSIFVLFFSAFNLILHPLFKLI